jgi:hypothetical protein
MGKNGMAGERHGMCESAFSAAVVLNPGKMPLRDGYADIPFAVLFWTCYE